MLLALNKKAKRNYEVIEKYIAGIVLNGYEVKALREGKADFEGSYIKLIENRPYVVNLNIGRYSNQSHDGEPKRDRLILLTKKELASIQKELSQKGKSAVPLALVLQHNLVKLELAVVKGRKKHEKKHLEKERQIQKDLDKAKSAISRAYNH